MAKAKKPAKKVLSKQAQKKTKGGILIGLNQPSFIKIAKPGGTQGVVAPSDSFMKF